MRDRQYYASLGMFALAVVVAAAGLVAFSWVLGAAGAMGLLAVAGAFLWWLYWGPRPDLKRGSRRGGRGRRRHD